MLLQGMTTKVPLENLNTGVNGLVREINYSTCFVVELLSVELSNIE